MLKHYLKIAVRNFRKNKVLSTINITGLSAGLAVFLLITLYVLDELTHNLIKRVGYYYLPVLTGGNYG